MKGIYSFKQKDKNSFARLGTLSIRGREIPTPVFMPVGSLANIKGLDNFSIEEIGYEIILCNAYHLFLRPGTQIISEAGSLHDFMAWNRALLTDSGGYQVFSLAHRAKFDKDGSGVTFASHLDGSLQRLSPKIILEAQLAFSSDIMMPLDDCPPASASASRVQESLERTHRWACEIWLLYQEKVERGLCDTNKNHLFGIVQGCLDLDARKSSLDHIQNIDFSGIAIGGLSVGEERPELYKCLESLAPLLDSSRPRYLMGVGTIRDILEAVKNGIDMFDCVLPTRNARNGQAFCSFGLVKIRNEKYKKDFTPLDTQCTCKVCKRYSKAYLRHLFMNKEMLGPILFTYHNLHFYFSFMQKLRNSIAQESGFLQFYEDWKDYPNIM